MKPIKLAIAGVGNCASSLLQGIEYYKHNDGASGLMHRSIGGYEAGDIVPVAAFDVDIRKVGKPLHVAMFAKPNCTTVFHAEVPDYGVTVLMGPTLDGIAAHMRDFADEQSFLESDANPVDIEQVLRCSEAEVLLCYLPVGAERAARVYADACLAAGVAMVNCVPVFLASEKEYADKFAKRNLPIVGDDIKSQFGATIVHRVLARMLCDRGVKPLRTYQLNTGGNTDFLNMLERSRLSSKKRSKTEAIQSQFDSPLEENLVHVGPSDYVPWLKDNKIGFIRLEWAGFGDVPMNLEVRLSVEDSPNSAGIAIDALRFAKLALDRGIGGPLEAVSAYLMKRPPRQMRDDDARSAISEFLGNERVAPAY